VSILLNRVEVLVGREDSALIAQEVYVPAINFLRGFTPGIASEEHISILKADSIRELVDESESEINQHKCRDCLTEGYMPPTLDLYDRTCGYSSHCSM